ncbi:MAG: hypothetical protein M1817_003443 [Caeruleum heppii]|nr:MAG: hypothetical protein M1817_003443 [Caeruleum heppii]
MSAAVATRSQQQNQPHTSSPSSTRMGNKSPVDKKKYAVKTEGPEAPPTIAPSPDQKHKKDPSGLSNAETTEPLAPPPRPAPQNAAETPDYFSTVHDGSHLSLEPNPFEQSFGNPAVETPGKSLLPPVASLTSPASLLRDGAASTGFNWPNSLRSGPLSPAMLTGPTGASDYFESHLRGGFPTPNESSLRTGLTPGGGGSMFPAPSPNSQALFQQLANSGATPSTIDFHRTAMSAAAVRKHETDLGSQSNLATSQSTDQEANGATANVSQPQLQQAAPVAQQAADPFGQHDANDAANGLFLLAQARNGHQAQEPSTSGLQPPAVPQRHPNVQMSTQPTGSVQAQQTSPRSTKKGSRAHGGSLGGSISGSARGMSEMSGDFSESGGEEKAKPNTRNKAKKGGNQSRSGQANSARRKAEEAPPKAPPTKKARVSSGISMPDFNVDSDEDDDNKEEMLNENGKKMTDEEKRKNFLERNRVAALKCRQRKKQWLANLQAKVEIFSSENDTLNGQVAQMREEIVNLKTLLLAHKDCPVSQAQGMGGMGMNGMGGDFTHHSNPYGMAMANSGQVMAGQGVQRRYG